MQIASEYYGDATQWTAVAEANDMNDPLFDDTRELVIPRSPSKSGGVKLA